MVLIIFFYYSIYKKSGEILMKIESVSLNPMVEKLTESSQRPTEEQQKPKALESHSIKSILYHISKGVLYCNGIGYVVHSLYMNLLTRLAIHTGF
jgi:hypothetical protein